MPEGTVCPGVGEVAMYAPSAEGADTASPGAAWPDNRNKDILHQPEANVRKERTYCNVNFYM